MVEKQREFYKNAKLVKKYKSSVKSESDQSYQLPAQVYEVSFSSDLVIQYFNFYSSYAMAMVLCETSIG
jgi:hypothetical protein